MLVHPFLHLFKYASINLPILPFHPTVNNMTSLFNHPPSASNLHKTYVQELTHRNLYNLGIEMTAKARVEYAPMHLLRMDFKDGWWCYYTDNYHLLTPYKLQYSILTIHGSPGDHRDWPALEQECLRRTTLRWVNLIIPGFDCKEMRRGTYSGTANHLSQLVLRLATTLQLPRVIFVGHSLGSIFATHLLTHHPSFAGYVNVTGIINYWYTGLLTFFTNCTLNVPTDIPNLSDEERIAIHKEFLTRSQDLSFSVVPFPLLSLHQFWAYATLITSFPHEINHLYTLNRELKIKQEYDVPQVLIFGRKDPLHEVQKTNATLWEQCKGFPKIHPKLRDYLRWRGIPLANQLQSLQELFCYHLIDTGHNAHKRRPKEIARIIEVYIKCLNALEQYHSIPKL